MIKRLTLTLLVLSAAFSVFGQRTIENDLSGKTAAERTEIKSDAIVARSANLTKTYLDAKTGVTLAVTAVDKIEGGVAVYAKAWTNGNPVGFGPDGTVEIERFQIFNPPILVYDPDGEIVRVSTEDAREYRLRLDPVQAILDVISHNVTIIGKDGGNIIPGKVGSTTSTFYPDSNPESTSADGYTRRNADAVWSTIRSGAGEQAGADNGPDSKLGRILAAASSNIWSLIQRIYLGFDTSSIPTL